MWEEDLHMALCIVKVVALVVIASSLWSMVSGGGYGYASDFGVKPSSWDGSGSYGTSAGLYNVENSQAILQKGGFGNRYEPPTFWNIGDLSTVDQFQHQSSNLGIVSYAEPAAPAPTAVPPTTGGFRGYNKEVKRGYATNVITPY